MSYLARLKAEFSGKPLPSELTKPTKAPSVSFVSAPSRHVSELEALDTVPDSAPEAHRQDKTAELARHMRDYAKRNGFTQADFDEALRVAMAGDIDGWIAYLCSQNETRH